MLPNGRKMYKSIIGLVLTVFTVMAVSFYAVYKWQLLLDHDEARVVLTTEDDYFQDHNSTFS